MRLLDEIPTMGCILTQFDSGDKVGLCCQSATENLAGKLIGVLALLGGKLGELCCLICAEIDLHDLRVGIDGTYVNHDNLPRRAQNDTAFLIV